VGFVALSHPTTANKSKRMTFPRRACVRVLLKRRRARHAQAGSDPRQIAAAGGAARIRSGPVKQTNNRRNRSPDERSEIRGRSRGLHAACTPRPGFRSAHPGYEERKGGGAPADAYFLPPRPHLYPPPLAGEERGGGTARVQRDAPPVGVPPRHLPQRTNAAAQLRAPVCGDRASKSPKSSSWLVLAGENDMDSYSERKCPNNRIQIVLILM